MNNKDNYFESFQQTPHGLKTSYYNPFMVKHRRRTSKMQLRVLEKTFETNVRPDANLRKILGEQLGMTPRSVQVWFQNRRAKIKKRKSDQPSQNTQTSFQTTNERAQTYLYNAEGRPLSRSLNYFHDGVDRYFQRNENSYSGFSNEMNDFNMFDCDTDIYPQMNPTDDLYDGKTEYLNQNLGPQPDNRLYSENQTESAVLTRQSMPEIRTSKNFHDSMSSNQKYHRQETKSILSNHIHDDVLSRNYIKSKNADGIEFFNPNDFSLTDSCGFQTRSQDNNTLTNYEKQHFNRTYDSTSANKDHNLSKTAHQIGYPVRKMYDEESYDQKSKSDILHGQKTTLAASHNDLKISAHQSHEIHFQEDEHFRTSQFPKCEKKQRPDHNEMVRLKHLTRENQSRSCSNQGEKDSCDEVSCIQDVEQYRRTHHQMSLNFKNDSDKLEMRQSNNNFDSAHSNSENIHQTLHCNNFDPTRFEGLVSEDHVHIVLPQQDSSFFKTKSHDFPLKSIYKNSNDTRLPNRTNSAGSLLSFQSDAYNIQVENNAEMFKSHTSQKLVDSDSFYKFECGPPKYNTILNVTHEPRSKLNSDGYQTDFLLRRQISEVYHSEKQFGKDFIYPSNHTSEKYQGSYQNENQICSEYSSYNYPSFHSQLNPLQNQHAADNPNHFYQQDDIQFFCDEVQHSGSKKIQYQQNFDGFYPQNQFDQFFQAEDYDGTYHSEDSIALSHQNSNSLNDHSFIQRNFCDNDGAHLHQSFYMNNMDLNRNNLQNPIANVGFHYQYATPDFSINNFQNIDQVLGTDQMHNYENHHPFDDYQDKETASSNYSLEIPIQKVDVESTNHKIDRSDLKHNKSFQELDSADTTSIFNETRSFQKPEMPDNENQDGGKGH